MPFFKNITGHKNKCSQGDGCCIEPAFAAIMFNKSVFRLAQGVQYKDRTMTVKNAGVPAGQCMGVAASHQYIAVPYGAGGNLSVLPINFSDFKRDDNPPFISAHSTPLADFKFSPFDASLLATGAEDGVVKLWEVPSGGLTSTISEPKVATTTTAIISFILLLSQLFYHPSPITLL